MKALLTTVVLVVGVCWAAAPAEADTLSWQRLGSLRTDRQHHKARYIGNGRVLVIGGYTMSTGILTGKRSASCELIDVHSNTIRSAAPLALERGVVSTAEADDGTIYVLGGDTDDGLTDLVERYDAESNTWEIVGRLAVPRWQHASAFISSTEILVVAGWGENRAEIFDVTTGTSTVVADFPWGANALVTIPLQQHRPAFIGGRTAGPNTPNTSTAMAFDQTRNRWISVCEFPERTVRPTSLLLMNGHVLLTGGTASERPFVTRTGIDVVKDLYDVARIGSLATGRQWHGMAQWPDGRVIVAGGFTDDAVIVASTEWIDPRTGSVATGPTMIEPHAYGEIVTFSDRGAYYALMVSGLNSLATGTPIVEMIVERCASGDVPLVNKNYNVVGAVVPRSAAVELTSSTPFSRGAIWAREKVSLQNRFSTLVGFRMTNGDDNGEIEELPSDPGADGIAIVLQNQSSDAIGQFGRGIGYDGIKRSIAVEIDTYHNAPVNDPNGNHIGLQSMGYEANTSKHAPPANLAFSNSIPQMKADGTIYYVLVEYADGRLSVYFNHAPSFYRPVIVREIDLDSLIGLDLDKRAWIGITSATGQSVEQHEVVRWEINGCDRDLLVSVPEEPLTERLSDNVFRIRGTRLERLHEGQATIALFDCQGRLLHVDVTNEPEVDLGTLGLSNGFYLIHASSSGRVQALALMIVR